MKLQILAFFLLSVAFIHAQDQDPKLTYFYLIDSSESTVNGPDGESQFFDYPTGINVELPINTSIPNNLFQLGYNFLVNNFSIPASHINHGHVISIKTYWRNAGYLPLALVQSEMNLSNQDPSHIADAEATMLSVEYLYYDMPIPADQDPYEVKHQVQEICVQFPQNDFRHFIVDRGYRGIYPDTWNSRVRVIYVGQTTDCSLTSKDWADVKAGNWSDNGTSTPQLTVWGTGNIIDRGYHLDDLFSDINYYFEKFPNYNTLYNCQHFGTNLFNHLTGQNLQFISKDVMEIITNGVSNLPKLKFNFLPLPYVNELNDDDDN